MISTRCTGCSRLLRVQDHLLGKMVKCSHCQATFSAELSDEVNSNAPVAMDNAPTPPASDEPKATPAAMPAGNPLVAAQTSANPQAPPGWIGTLAKPLPSLPFQVFGIIAAIVMLAAAIGFGLGSWFAAGIR